MYLAAVGFRVHLIALSFFSLLTYLLRPTDAPSRVGSNMKVRVAIGMHGMSRIMSGVLCSM